MSGAGIRRVAEKATPYYLSTVMDDFSRYIIVWQLCRTMKAEDVKNTLDMAIAETWVEHVQVVQRPRLLSDNRDCFIFHELKKYLETHEIRHVPTKVYHPMTQGKIECYHRSMKNLILLVNYYAPAELTERIWSGWNITITSGITRPSTT